jgi:DNA-binding CsgD family transcriptional regulator
MGATNSNLLGQSIAVFLPGLKNALRPREGAQLFRTSMLCEGRRGKGETFAAEVWFSTYEERGAPKLAAIIADVTEDQALDAPCAVEENGAVPPSFNKRQVAVLQLVFEGLPNSAIASRLEMTPSAVKNTIQQLFSRAGVSSRSQLVRVALERYRDLL